MQTDLLAGVAATRGKDWYACSSASVAKALGVNPAKGLTAVAAADRLRTGGPNALPEEKPKPGWLRFLDEYRSDMQIILIAAAIVSLFVQESGTAVLLFLLTVLNAVIGLRQKGKAESAMNALMSMMKATARVQRDGRIIAANALQLDESALTGESTPKEKSPFTKELDRLTLWIAAAAGLTMIVMFILGRSRGEAWDVLFHRLLNTVELNVVQFLWAVVPAVGLLLLWEIGKLIARRTAGDR